MCEKRLEELQPMNLNQLRYIITVNECGSFSKAAQKLYITQPTLSQQIAALESELGVRLFTRGKRVALTDAGAALMRHAQAMLEEQDRMLLTMSEYARLKRGTLKIGALWSLDFLGIVNLIGDFLRQVPELHINLIIDGSSNLYRRLLSHELDAIFNLVGRGSEIDPHLAYQVLQHHQYVVAVPQNHPFQSKQYLTIQDLDGQPIIIPDKTSILYELLLTTFREHGVHPVIVCECIPFNSSMQLTKSGLGLNITTYPTARPLDIIDGCTVLPLISIVDDPFSLVYMTHTDSLSIQAVDTFSRFVQSWSAAFLGK